MSHPHDAAELAQAEARVEEKSASLRKELRVRDLALTQILFIIGLTWIGVAGKLGPSHVVMWLLAVVLFFLPLAAVVLTLPFLLPYLSLRSLGFSLEQVRDCLTRPDFAPLEVISALMLTTCGSASQATLMTGGSSRT